MKYPSRHFWVSWVKVRTVYCYLGLWSVKIWTMSAGMLYDGVFLFVYTVSHVCESKGGLYVNVKLHFCHTTSYCDYCNSKVGHSIPWKSVENDCADFDCKEFTVFQVSRRVVPCQVIVIENRNANSGSRKFETFNS